MILEITSIFNYYILFFFCFFGFVLSIFLLTLSLILKQTHFFIPDMELSSAYECGFLPFDKARTKVEVKFFMVALIFVVFDLEIIFIFPWSICLAMFSLVQVFFMIVFLTILVFSFIYELYEGALLF